MGILTLYTISYSKKIPIPFSSNEVLYVVNVKIISGQSFPISSLNLQNCIKKENESKFSNHSGDAMHRLSNTSPNTEAAVHRYSEKLWKKPKT